MSRRRSLFNLTSVQQNDESVNLLQNNLIKEELNPNISFKHYERVYEQTKDLSRMLAREKQRKLEAQTGVREAKKNVIYLKQLQDSVDRKISHLQVQTEKVSDVYKMNKILMMEKILRMQREADDLYKKKDQCQRIRAQKMQSVHLTKLRIAQKSEDAKLRSLNETQWIRRNLEESESHTMQLKRRRVGEIRSEQERRRSKSRKIEQFKQERARSNYFQKILELGLDIIEKQNALNAISKEEVVHERRVDATDKVTQQCLNSFFATEATTL